MPGGRDSPDSAWLENELNNGSDTSAPQQAPPDRLPALARLPSSAAYAVGGPGAGALQGTGFAKLAKVARLSASPLTRPRRSSVNEAGGVSVAVCDHADISISFWQWDIDVLKETTVAIPDLRKFMQRTLQESLEEYQLAKGEFDQLERRERRIKEKANERPRSETCRWYHLPGINYAAVEMFHEIYHLLDDVAEECKAAASKPSCAWHQQVNRGNLKAGSTFDHLSIVGHYIIPSGMTDDDGIEGFKYEQCQMVYFPDLNTLLSIDGNGEKTWDGVVDLLTNQRGFVRSGGDMSLVIYKLLDSMIDEVYPLLDLYGDLLEGLEFRMVNASEPTVDHIRVSFKLDRAVRSLRRYSWNARQLLQELRQDNFGVISKITVKMMTSVERNTENITEVASAYIEQCDGIMDFYDSFQEKLQGSTLYVLTIASVTIMPLQFMTGLYGMNFAWEAEATEDTNDDGVIDSKDLNLEWYEWSHAMPELHMKHGYVYFWVLGLFLTAAVVMAMHKKGILQSRSIHWATTLDASIMEEEEKRHDELSRFRNKEKGGNGGASDGESNSDPSPSASPSKAMELAGAIPGKGRKELP